MLETYEALKKNRICRNLTKGWPCGLRYKQLKNDCFSIFLHVRKILDCGTIGRRRFFVFCSSMYGQIQ
jgi:hypothetical protein